MYWQQPKSLFKISVTKFLESEHSYCLCFYSMPLCLLLFRENKIIILKKDKQCETIHFLTKEAQMSLSLLLCACVSFELLSSVLQDLKFSWSLYLTLLILNMRQTQWMHHAMIRSSFQKVSFLIHYKSCFLYKSPKKSLSLIIMKLLSQQEVHASPAITQLTTLSLIATAAGYKLDIRLKYTTQK